LQSAREYIGKAIGIKKNHYGENHVKVAESLVDLGNCLREVSDSNSGREYIKNAIGIETRYYDENHVNVARGLVNLGKAFRD
jgi:hypothetical protein